MRILHVLGCLDRGGAETSLVRYLRHIDRNKYQFDFLVHTEQPGAYDEEIKALGARVIPCLSPAVPVRYARNFLRIVRECGPYDCVHSHVHHFSGYVLTLARVAGIPRRIAHSHTHNRAVDKNSPVARKLYVGAMKALLALNATSGLAVSDKAAEALFGGDWREDARWQVVHLGIDLTAFQTPPDRWRVREEFGIPGDALVVGHVGRFSIEKNHSFLLKMFKLLRDRKSDAFLLMVGDGPTRRGMETMAEELGISHCAKFVGSRNDVPRFLAVMDVFVFPSLYEGFPVALMEAQAAGLRCLISDAISREVDILPGLLRRLSINDSAEAWARAVLEDSWVSGDWTISDPMRDYGMDAATSRLCRVYDSE